MTIEFHTWTTPNGRKVGIMLEELGLDYSVHTVNIGKDEQFAPAFLKISPNNRIPAIIDSDGPDGEPFSVFESGAILIYLAEKSGKFLPASGVARHRVMEWLMWQMGGVGPMLGQTHHFRRAAKVKNLYGIERYTNESHRLYGVADRQLANNAYLAGAEYSIADMATFPWVARHEWHATDLNDFLNVKRWYAQVAARPAVQTGMAVPPVDYDPIPSLD
jgi:GST-like protein